MALLPIMGSDLDRDGGFVVAVNDMGLTEKYNDPIVAEGYHRRRYGDWQGRLNLRAMRHALAKALVHVLPGGRVLDVPCGTGQYSWALAVAGFQVTAADSSPEMLKVAATLLRIQVVHAPRFQVEDIFRLSFDPLSFEAAVCIRFFNLVDRARRIAALRELSRVADVVIASYNHRPCLKHLSRLVRFSMGRHSRPKARLSRQQLVEESGEAGLVLGKLIPVAPLLSEVSLLVLAKPATLGAGSPARTSDRE